MAKPIQIQLSFPVGRIRRLLSLGEEHQMQNCAGALKNATIATKIISFILDKRSNEVIDRILAHKKCTLFELITSALLEYAARHGYLRKGEKLE